MSVQAPLCSGDPSTPKTWPCPCDAGWAGPCRNPQGKDKSVAECRCKYSDADYEALVREAEKLRSALEVMAGPGERSPWLKDYLGLQAIAEKGTWLPVTPDAYRANDKEMLAERDFLLARAHGANECRFGEGERMTGISSNEMVRAAFAGEEANEHKYPSDPSDLAACVRTYLIAPKHLKEPMAQILEKYRHHVERRYPGASARVDAYLAGDRSEWVVKGVR